MSYDIRFVKRRDGQSWEDAIEALEETVEGLGDEVRSLSTEMIEAWERIVPQARAVLGEIDIFVNADSRELTHDSTGIQLSIFSDEADINVPYWHSGDAVTVVFSKVYSLAAIIERETGLEAFDPQAGIRLSELSLDDAAALMSQVTTDLRYRYGAKPALEIAAVQQVSTATVATVTNR